MEGLGFARQRLVEEIIRKNFGIEPNGKNYSYKELLFILQEMLTDEGKNYLEGKSDKFGYVRFRNFAKHLLYRNLANYDTMCLMTSDKGGGKSSAAIMLAKYWCFLLGKRFDPAKHIAYNNVDLMQKIDKAEKFDVIIADESVRFCSSENWAKKENKQLKIKLAQVRTKHILFILCFPLKIEKVDKVYLESFVNYWIDIIGRGVGITYVKDKNPSRDSWRIKHFGKIGSFNEFTPQAMVEKILKKHPNFWMTIKFPKPGKKLYDKYLNIRERNVYDNESVMAMISKEDIYRALLVLSLKDIMLNDKTLSMNRIMLHIKNEYDIPLSKAMIESVVEDAKQLITRIKEENKPMD